MRALIVANICNLELLSSYLVFTVLRTLLKSNRCEPPCFISFAYNLVDSKDNLAAFITHQHQTITKLSHLIKTSWCECVEIEDDLHPKNTPTWSVTSDTK